jgi:acetyl-CoA carboxylase carboxyl transferase subunit alpha
MISYLEFEKPVAALEARIAELRETAAASGELDIAAEIRRLENKSAELLASTYRALSPWQKTQVARHPARPHFRDYVANMFTGFMPLGGDRLYGEDQAIIGGFARLGDRRVMLIGHEKGHDTQSRIKHNFGMGKPEGYRKAVRLMEMASRFGLPVVTLVDTSGAFPGVEAEERGQAEAIARSTQACLELGVPMVATIVGEGGSGGAVALASAERVLMLEHAVYSVISPEGCASILWRTAAKAPDAAEAMKVTAQDLLGLGVIDRIVAEPVGGAHRDPVATCASLATAIGEELDHLAGKTPDSCAPCAPNGSCASGPDTGPSGPKKGRWTCLTSGGPFVSGLQAGPGLLRSERLIRLYRFNRSRSLFCRVFRNVG